MKARIFRIDTDAHSHTERVLPWYVNGTLDADERAQVEAHLSTCARCRTDAEFQARLRSVSGEIVAPNDADAARGWAALQERLAERAAPDRRRPAGRPRWTSGGSLALAVQAVLVIGLAAALLIGVSQHPDHYQALGSALSAPSANAVVVFRPDATEAQIRAALLTSDARFVGGPTATDAYLLQMPGDGAAALRRLRAQPAVLRVESLVGEAPP